MSELSSSRLAREATLRSQKYKLDFAALCQLAVSPETPDMEVVQAYESMDEHVRHAGIFVTAHLDVLTQAAKAEMADEFNGREQAQAAPKAEIRDIAAPATDDQALMISRLVRRNIQPNWRGACWSSHMIPGGKVLTVEYPTLAVNDSEGRPYTTQISFRALGAGELADQDAYTYFINDHGIEQDILIHKQSSDVSDTRSVQLAIIEATILADAKIGMWDDERQLGMHTVSAVEAENLAELLRYDWQQISLSQFLGEEPLPEIM